MVDLEENVYEVKRRIISYINDDFKYVNDEIKSITKNILQEFLDNMVIKNSNIETYVKGNFTEVLIEIQQMLKNRENLSINIKTDIFNRLNYEDYEDKTLYLLEESQIFIDYKEISKRILEDNVNNSICHVSGLLSVLGFSETKIENVECELYAVKRYIKEKFGTKINDLLRYRDKKITEFAVELYNEYIKPLKKEQEEQNERNSFVQSLTVNNDDNQIETNALENMQKLLDCCKK